ncbi:hypothetical protein LUZ63_007045 [Rhynchospora breviuscula]|uniref:BSD domain-containing protein n=1 Tax=Rhynchospora breviuscula TaxID=2022672 RepID=A0A9Q0HUQ4_9POAL|nr:hypothetical protein LUZ63_007045 [Rhynchospora breviuscula]
MARGLRGVRDDLSELGRHLLDIACFLPLLAPTHCDSPPHTPRLSIVRPRRRSPSPLPNSPPLLSGILSDLAEIGGALTGGISRLSVSPRALPDSHTDTSAILSLTNPQPLSAPRDAVGVSDDIVEFVAALARCPESWIEFPVPTNDGFNMTNAQKDHVASMERLAPELAALRARLCPVIMTQDSFYKIYFALLHMKLNEHDSELLSTQQIVDSMRAMLRGTEIRSNSSDSSEKEITPTNEIKGSIHRENSYQSSMVQSFAKTRSDQSLENQWIFAKTQSQQSMDQWSDLPSDVDYYNFTREGSSRRHGRVNTDDLSSSDVEKGHVTNVLLLDQYMDSLLSDGKKTASVSSSVKRDHTRRKHSSIDCRSSEESEFEMLDS